MTAPSTFIATDRPGVVLVESSSHAGEFYVISGYGTPFVVCNCRASSWKGDCRHRQAALAVLAADTCECGHEAHTGRCTAEERVPDYRPGGNPWWWKRCTCVKEGAA